MSIEMLIINIRDIFWHATFLFNMSTERLLWILHVECVHHWRKCHVQSFQRETGTWAAGHEAFPVNVQCFHSKWVPHLYNTVKTYSIAASFKNSFFYSYTYSCKLSQNKYRMAKNKQQIWESDIVANLTFDPSMT